jgi:hypothetical protein
MEECGHVLKQLIQSGLMNSEKSKTECRDKKLTFLKMILFTIRFMQTSSL